MGADAEVIRAYLARLDYAGFAASTAARRLSAVKQFYRFLYGDGLRGDDPAAAIEGPKQGRPLPKVLSEADVALEGTRAVVIGRSVIVGKPMALLLIAANATVTVAHSRTKDLPALAAEADVLVVAAGRAEMVRGDWVKEGATVIDVGTNRTDDGLKGDVAFDEASERAGAITPVPGGVGPMTRAYLLVNTLAAARRRVGDDS